MPHAHAVVALALCAGLAQTAAAQDWTNHGGNERRNGLSNHVGPDAPTVLWTNTARPSIIAWQPVTLGDRMFVVRQTGFPPEPSSDESPVVAYDLNTGQELWFFNVPFRPVPTEWTTHILGARDGKVYVSRSGGGGNVTPPPNGQAPIYALDAATGAVVWQSTATTAAGPYEGAVFAENGDLIIGDFLNVTRVRASDGAQVYKVARSCPVSGSCGVAINTTNNSTYAIIPVPGGNVIRRFLLDTGAASYQTPTLPGFTSQNGPFVGPDGTVFFSRTQNSAPVDVFYSFRDTGSALVQNWSTPSAWSTTGEFGCGPDNSVYMIGPGYVVQRRDGAGNVLATSTVTVGSYAQRMAVDGLGRLFLSDATNNRLTSFNADLTVRWDLPQANPNIGAPALAPSGTLIVANTNSIRAFRTATSCYANCDGSTGNPLLTPADFVCFLNRYRAGDPYANCDQSTGTPALTPADFVCFLNRFRAGC